MTTKFLCDQMCADLGRWLRTAGFDTVIIESATDDVAIFKRAQEEGRRLITKDRHFLELDPERKTIVFLKGDALEEWAEQLRQEEKIDWLYHPFSRCLECNSLLQKTPPPADLPQQVRETNQEFWLCPHCHKTYWLGSHTERMYATLKEWNNKETTLKIGFGGDFMIGRLVDHYLNHRSPLYVWGDLHSLLSKMDVNIINLETTLTKSTKIRPKVFNFKAHPAKVAVLNEGPVHAVNLANNHILDFSEEGLFETIETLDKAHILHVGAGKDLSEARKPLIIEKRGIKIGVLGCTDNEPDWKAGVSHPGTNYLEIGDLEPLQTTITDLRDQVDLLILSIHWGPNMQQRPSTLFRTFAHTLIDLGVDILHGHSAHIFQGVEVYKQKLILYDTGDLADDYAIDPLLRNDLSFYFVVKVQKEKLLSLEMIPTQISNFQVNLYHEHDSLEKMESLCQELDTFPLSEKGKLVLSISEQ